MALIKLPLNWLEDDDEEQTPRYTRNKKTEREHVNLKMPASMCRFIDELTYGRVTSLWKTRSDFINDACHQLMWKTKNNPKLTDAAKMILANEEFENIVTTSSRFTTVLTSCTEAISSCIKMKDMVKLEDVLEKMEEMRSTFIEKAGKVHLESIEFEIKRVKDILR